MGVYKRQLKGCLRWRFGGSYKGEKYTSKAIYGSPEEAEKAEREFLARFQQDSLAKLTNERLRTLRVQGVNEDYLIDTKHKFGFALDFFGPDKLVADISKADAYRLIEAIASDPDRKGKTTHPANHAIRIMKAFFNWCINEREIEIRNPFYKMKLLPLSQQRKYVPTEYQVYKLREKLNAKQKALFRFVEATGCRIMEAIRLDMRDVREDSVTLWTRKARNRNLTPRVIPRPRSFQPKVNQGRPFSTWDHYPRFLGEMVAHLGQHPRWNWHNLRHKAATEWANDGMTTFEIMSRLGHNNISTTMIYLHQLGIYRV